MVRIKVREIMIALYAVKTPTYIENFTYEELLHSISLKKQKRILMYAKREDAYKTLIADMLIRTIICNKYSHIKNHELNFTYNMYGKPSVENLYFPFNVSHSGDWVVCAVHRFPIGVDIEKIQPIDLSIAEHFFTKQEYEYLFQIKDHKEKLNYFYQIWTIKESYVKAIGKGLSIPLNSFKIGEDSEQGANWFIKQYMIDELYCLSVCAKTSEFPEYINHQLDFSQLYNLYKQIKNN